MQTNHPPSDGVSVVKLMQRFPNEASAIEYFEGIRWKDGVVCPHCGNADASKMWKLEADKDKKIRVGLRQCAACKKQFRVTVGTLFEDSHIPLNIWIVAWYLFAGAKKSISAKQMQRHLGLGSYKTAWFLCHRIRHAMGDPVFEGKLSGTVEVDEVWIGGKQKHRRTRAESNKVPLVSLVERSEEGTKRSYVLRYVNAKNLRHVIRENVEAGSNVNTDELSSYKGVKPDGFKHETVNHSKEQYVRKFKDGHKVTTNTVESSFSLLRRAIIGQFHHISHKHLHRYAGEMDHRWNTRKKTDAQRMEIGLAKTEGKRLSFRPLIDEVKGPIDLGTGRA